MTFHYIYTKKNLNMDFNYGKTLCDGTCTYKCHVKNCVWLKSMTLINKTTNKLIFDPLYSFDIKSYALLNIRNDNPFYHLFEHILKGDKFYFQIIK